MYIESWFLCKLGYLAFGLQLEYEVHASRSYQGSLGPESSIFLGSGETKFHGYYPLELGPVGEYFGSHLIPSQRI